MTTWPAASTPCTWKTDFAMSRPIVVIVCMDAPPNRGSLNSAHIFGTHVPVEEPSTASEPGGLGLLRRTLCTGLAAVVLYLVVVSCPFRALQRNRRSWSKLGWRGHGKWLHVSPL